MSIGLDIDKTYKDRTSYDLIHYKNHPLSTFLALLYF